jgi:hypothetical protein
VKSNPDDMTSAAISRAETYLHHAKVMILREFGPAVQKSRFSTFSAFVLDELAAGLDHVAHQLGEEVVGLVDMSSTLTCSSVRASGSSVVSHSWSGFISPSPL